MKDIDKSKLFAKNSMLQSFTRNWPGRRILLGMQNLTDTLFMYLGSPKIRHLLIKVVEIQSVPKISAN